MKYVRAKEKYARNSYENFKQEPNSREQQQEQPATSRKRQKKNQKQLGKK